MLAWYERLLTFVRRVWVCSGGVFHLCTAAVAIPSSLFAGGGATVFCGWAVPGCRFFTGVDEPAVYITVCIADWAIVLAAVGCASGRRGWALVGLESISGGIHPRVEVLHGRRVGVVRAVVGRQAVRVHIHGWVDWRRRDRGELGGSTCVTRAIHVKMQTKSFTFRPLQWLTPFCGKNAVKFQSDAVWGKESLICTRSEVGMSCSFDFQTSIIKY